jgi:hypothetical protein
MVFPETNGKNCLGYWLRDKGQSLVPAPPDKTTGVMVCVPLKRVIFSLIVYTVAEDMTIKGWAALAGP